MSEAVFQRSVLDLATRLGWRAAHFHDSRRQVAPGRFVGDTAAAGFPDLVMTRGCRLIFAELKGRGGKVRPNQTAWLTALANCAVEVYVWYPADWDEIVRVLGGAAVTTWVLVS